jgi:hypothetical protein
VRMGSGGGGWWPMKDEGKEESGFRSGIICKLKIYFVKTRPAIKCSNVKKEPVDSRLGPSLSQAIAGMFP